MSERELQALRKETEIYRKVAAARVYSTDKEISDVIKKAKVTPAEKIKARTYPFATQVQSV